MDNPLPCNIHPHRPHTTLSDAFLDPRSDFLIRSDPWSQSKKDRIAGDRFFLGVPNFSCVCTRRAYIYIDAPFRPSYPGGAS